MVERSRNQGSSLELGAGSKPGCENDATSRLREPDQHTQGINGEYWRETQILRESEGLHELTETEGHRHETDRIRKCLMDRDRCSGIAQ
jgi:hypothetical protein